MAEWFKGYAGNTGQRAGRWALDKLLAGNNLGADGTLQNEGLGLAGTSASVLAGLFGGPLAGSAARRGADRAVDWYANRNSGLSPYGPYASGYQLPAAQPFASGASGIDMGYAVIPHYGGGGGTGAGGGGMGSGFSGGEGGSLGYSSGGYNGGSYSRGTFAHGLKRV